MSSLPRQLLVLDLDETLIHTNFEWSIMPPNYDFHGTIDAVYMRTQERPGVRGFLESVHAWFRVVVFTAGTQPYAEYVVKNVFPAGINPVIHSRVECVAMNTENDTSHIYIKDLQKVRGFDKDHTIFVDDREYSFLQRDNGVRVQPYTGDASDSELFYLCAYLWMYWKVGKTPGNVRSWRSATRTILKACLPSFWQDCSNNFKCHFLPLFERHRDEAVGELSHILSLLPPQEVAA